MKKNRLLSSFIFAWQGIVHAMQREKNFRIHVLAAVIVLVVGSITKLSYTEWILIILCIGGVISLELINSALERVVDLASPTIHELAKQAKDLSAAAVLVFALASAIIGILIFLPKWMEIFN